MIEALECVLLASQKGGRREKRERQECEQMKGVYGCVYGG